MRTKQLPDINQPSIRTLLFQLPLVFFASLIGAVGVNLFIIPAELAPGGVVGVGILLNEVTGVPVALVVFLGNVVLLSLGYRQLGGWNTIILTVIFAMSYALNIELTRTFIPETGLSDERLLNTLYAGIVGGLSGGLIYRLGGTMGGSSVLSRIIHNRFGVPTSTSYLYVDSVVVVAAGLVFTWESSLFSLLVLVIDGFVADYVLEGPSIVRTATIITNNPEPLSKAIMTATNRGVTSWTGTGRYTQQDREILFVTLGRSQVGTLRRVVAEVDDTAFLVIGTAHVAYGSGFKGMAKRPKQAAQPPLAPEPISGD